MSRISLQLTPKQPAEKSKCVVNLSRVTDISGCGVHERLEPAIEVNQHGAAFLVHWSYKKHLT